MTSWHWHLLYCGAIHVCLVIWWSFLCQETWNLFLSGGLCKNEIISIYRSHVALNHQETYSMVYHKWNYFFGAAVVFEISPDYPGDSNLLSCQNNFHHLILFFSFIESEGMMTRHRTMVYYILCVMRARGRMSKESLTVSFCINGQHFNI